MGSYRASRTEEDMKRELSDIMRSLKDPRIGGLVSIVKMELSRDMSHCRVFVSSLEGMDAAKSAAEGLTSASGYIKRELNARMKLRKLPAFKFVADDSIAHSADISRILEDLAVPKADGGEGMP